MEKKEGEKSGGAGEGGDKGKAVVVEDDGHGEDAGASSSSVEVVQVVAGRKEGNGAPMGAAPAPGEKVRVYPPPLLPHQEMIANPPVFAMALQNFHFMMGTRFMIPVIGGKQLDLHRLYLEVTRRGGLEKVTMDRRWREVIATFRFPRTTTSASFVLRKYYMSLLYHFEQVHFHNRQGPLLPPPASLHTKSLPYKPDDAPESSQQQIAMDRKRAFPGLPSKVPCAAAPPGFTVTGTINGKFDLGYMVTVRIGSETLHGVLYHTPEWTPSASSFTPALHNLASSCIPTGKTYKRRRRAKRYRDPAHPKPNRSAYNFFFAEKHSKLKETHPCREREFSKMIGESWSKLTAEERTVYQACGLKDKERYKREMQEYRMKLAAAHGGAHSQP